jgi:hypothetical protein
LIVARSFHDDSYSIDCFSHINNELASEKMRDFGSILNDSNREPGYARFPQRFFEAASPVVVIAGRMRGPAAAYAPDFRPIARTL